MNLFLAVLAIGMTSPDPSQPHAPFFGIARSKDGDSLMVGSREVRLFGIDAPEFDQTCTRNSVSSACGTESAEHLSRLVTGRDVRCRLVSTDQYGRAVSRCTVGTTDINATMVESGFATAFRQYSSDYVAAEARAKAARRGIWAGTFEAPQAYRREEKQARSASPSKPVRSQGRSNAWASRSACVIKGNQNRRGQWIYHLPGMPYYDQTRPEQLFCTETEAQAAGYRRAIVH
jgi:endonuclease YncB( thermonuclease family)